MTRLTVCVPTMVALSAVLAAGGCGAGTLSMIGGSSDETGDETGGDTDAGDGDTGDGDGAAACIVDGAPARALAVVDPDSELVHVFEAGGSQVSLPAALPEGVDAPVSLGVAASPGYLAVASSYSIYELPDVYEGSALRVYERGTHALLWSREFDAYRLGSTFIDAQGRVVASLGWSSAPKPAGVVVIDGQVTELDHFGPAGPLGPSNWMPGWIYDDQKETLGSGFYNPLTDELVQVTTGSSPPGWRVDGDRIEYLDNDAAVPRLVIAGPEAESAFELGPFAEVDSLVFLAALAGDYRLIASHVDNEPGAAPMLVRLDVATGELLPIDVEPPAGLEPFDCYTPSASIDADGRVLFELRDEGAAQIQAWDPESGIWTAVGAPMTKVDDINVARSFGSVLEIHGAGAGMTYCMPAEWSDPPAEAVPDSSIQLARIDPPLSVVLDTQGWGAVNVDEQEQCASWRNPDELHLLDLDDGDELELPVLGNLIWLD